MRLHDESYQTYEKLDCFNWIRNKKAEGKIRHMGFSYHGTHKVLEEILTKYPDMEFVQLQLNYADWENPKVQSRGVYEVARKHNKPIVVMEPVKGGALANLKEDIGAPLKAFRPDASYASWALRFVASHEGLLTILSGMSDEAQMNDNVKTMKDFEVLSEEEASLVEEVSKALAAIPTVGCTGCRYCTEGCPEKIAIPDFIRFLNDTRVYGYTEGTGRRFKMTIAGGSGKPSACLACGQCEDVCPQHLPVIEVLKECVFSVESQVK